MLPERTSAHLNLARAGPFAPPDMEPRAPLPTAAPDRRRPAERRRRSGRAFGFAASIVVHASVVFASIQLVPAVRGGAPERGASQADLGFEWTTDELVALATEPEPPPRFESPAATEDPRFVEPAREPEPLPVEEAPPVLEQLPLEDVLTRVDPRLFAKPSEPIELAEPVELAASPAAAPPGAEVLPEPLEGYTPRPTYPRRAELRRQEGLAVVRMAVDVDGRVTGVVLERSSGHELLDEAALRTARTWRFRPGRRLGVPAPMEVRQAFSFELDGRRG